MTTASLHRAEAHRDPGRPHRRVTVGVHDRCGCPGAVAWAAAEAHRTAADLALLECVPVHDPAWDDQPLAVQRAVLRRLLLHAPLGEAPILERAVGPVVEGLLTASRRSELLVLGRGRDLSPVVLQVALRAPRPVAAVPTTWMPYDVPATAPVLLGLPGLQPDGQGLAARALSYALVAARRRGVGVHLVAGWEPFATGTGRDRALRVFRRREQLVADAVRAVTQVYPEVPVRVSVPVGDLAAELVRLSAHARAVVLPPVAPLVATCLPRTAGPLVVVP
ncbi:universal stress protein [Nocardioides lianchengensis]|uniref:Universal stress protein family protein n=1 Tax=Nocardioides lianchengensis TaxID=1045774 RepID=A0A1G6YMI4_9ACTN|nr:universal stress protein [Nocardioides lianchengensis]NYG09615.1 hypothetical protein [Nocardioides lianchengensis]SDD90746.1 hypothetical protein SAMN05421872_11279 [Nocardioides lianchengensis]